MQLNRNYCLFTGQLFFLTVVGVRDRVDELTCTIITFMSHYTWMAVFAWTGEIVPLIN